MIEISNAEFSVLQQYLSRVCGIEIPPQKRYLFRTRLSSFLEEEKCASFSDLCTRLAVTRDKVLQNQLVQAMATHESSFFRDRHPFSVLQTRLLPGLAAQHLSRRSRTPPRLRILSCGCSLGQEPYTIAICVREWLETQKQFRKEDVTVLGIDLSARALERAMRGTYSGQEVGRFMPENYRARYLLPGRGTWQVTDEIRNMVNFAQLNLAESFGYIGEFDIIFCRNVIIYLAWELRQKIMEQFWNQLDEDGALILGASESLYALTDRFTTVHVGATTYYVPRKAAEPPP